MGIELRYPSITAHSERDQINQIKSYLFQLVEQLQVELGNMDMPSGYKVQEVKGAAQAQSVTADAEASFSAIKSLIIKSAEIVEAYYTEISSRLEGVYVAKSDFGTFTEHTEQEISQSSTDIEQLFTDLQAIITDIENLNFTLAEVNAHIRSGLLYYNDDSVPVYGLEIGQRNTVDGEEVFNKFARFTADRLSFYDQNDREVAYVSDYKLYIRNVEITSSYKVGGLVDTVMTNGDVVTKWVGGEG